MKNLSVFIIILAIGFYSPAFAQTVTVGGSPTSLPCGGGNVNFTANGNSSIPVFGDNFNNGGVAPGWAASAAAQFNNPCGASLDGSTYLWMGPGTSAPRNMTTAPVDVSCGGTVCFDFKFTCESCGDSSPCEGADLYNEGVSLQCSTNGGTTWTDFAYFAPNGDILTAWPGGVTSPYASGNPSTTWQNYCFTIPAGCETANTMFQLHQWGSSGSSYDHWGIDNFYVYATPCAPFYYDWAHIPGAPDSPNVTSNVTQSGWYTCCYTNGTLSACDSVFITVATLPPATVVTIDETCLGDNDGEVIIDNPGGNGPFSIVFSGPVSGTYTEGNGGPDDLNVDNLPPGSYSYTTTSNSGCVISGTFVINPGPACCTVSATGVDALCNGQASGSTTANPANGIAPYTYQWDAGTGNQTTQTANNLPAGTYSVTITDNVGCVANTSVTIGQPTALSATHTPTPPQCFGVCDGQIVVNAPSGGTPGYQYNLNGGTFGAISTFTGLCNGTYNLIVQDANGCQFPISNVVLTQPTDVTLVMNSTTPATCGATNGGLTVTAGGGTPGYTYTLNGPSAGTNGTGVFTGILPGNYIVDVVDANGCPESINVTVPSSAGPAPFIDIENDVACAGAFTGSVTIGVTGGTAPFQYSIDGGTTFQASNQFNGVPAGAYCVDIVDNFGCTGQVCGIIDEPTALTFVSAVTNATCNGVCDGEINVTANNATPPYQYSSDNGLTFQAGNVLTGLCAGNVDVVVTDANGCLANAVVNVGQPTPVTMSPGFVEPSCNGICDGVMGFGTSGGTAPYTYSIDDGVTFQAGIQDSLYNLCAGWYELAVMDANGCTVFDTITLTEPDPFTFVYVANNPSNCGANDGSFEITALGSSPCATYFYSIDGGTTIQVNNGFFLNLFAGLYQLEVTDCNGCKDSTVEALSDNIMITQTDLTVDATCYNSCDGLVLVSQQFGSPPYTYTLDFNTTSQPGGVFGGLCAGTHFITITDAGLCLGIEQFEIFEPDSIIIFTSQDSVTCNGGADGEITVTSASGGDGGPYMYSIDGVTFQASNVLTGLTAGTYTVYAQDGNGCLGTDDITVLEPTPVNANINQTDLVCNGDNTGFIQVLGNGGTPGYTYTLGGTPGNGVFVGLAANPGYAIVVTDANGCVYNTVQAVNEPPLLGAVHAPTDPLCFGSADGEIDVTANGGTLPYIYSPDNGVTFQSNNVLSNLADGCYDVLVEDDNGCQTTTNICITEPSQVTMTMVTTPSTCGNNNATIDVTANGGTPGYQYSNDNGTTFQAGTLFSGLSPINYTVVVEDANGCQADSTITLSADGLPQITNVVFNNPLCNGSADGDLVITATGGLAPLQYSINNGATFQATGTFVNLSAGIYNIVVEDDNGCQVSQQTTLTDPPVLSYSTVNTDLLCNGDFTGSIILTANGGTPTYQFSIDNGATFQGGGSFSFIAANTYDIVVEDANGCQVTGQEIINQPAPLAWNSFLIIDPICFSACDGQVQTTVGGGTPGYTYAWAGNIAGPNDVNATGVCASTYSVTVTDANGCQIDSTNWALVNPPAMQIPGLTTVDVSCYNGIQDMSNPGVTNFDGEITITPPVTGTPAYQYSINNGVTFQASNVFTGLQEGNYPIVVEDANGCRAFSNTTIYAPDSLYSIAPSDWTSCYGEDAVVQAFSNGGSVPYTFDWDIDGTGDFDDNPIFNHTVLAQATMTLQVMDANGCLGAPVSYTITPTPPMVLTPSLDTNICLGGTANLSVSVTGGQLIDFGTTLDYGYSWSPAGANDTLNTLDVSPNTPTTYTITVTDLCGEVVDTTINVGINPDPIVPILGPFEGCAPATMDFDISANVLPGYTVSWSLGNGSVVSTATPTGVVYPSPGSYDFSITITSDLGCTITQISPSAVTIYEPPVPGFYFDPHSPSVLNPTVSIVDISENALSYNYTFEGFGTSSEPEPTITFAVEDETTILVCQNIVSPEGCPASICIPLNIHEEILFYVPNVVTPDGDLFNETFFPVFTSGVDPFEYHLTIFNRWGEIVFESYNYDFGWDCTYGNGGLVDDGVYIWQIEFGEKLSDKKQTHRGHVTVLK